MFIYRVIEALKFDKVQFALAGGFAVALHGAVRGTIDLDIVVVLNLGNLVALEKALTKLGLHSRIPVTAKEIHQFREEYIKKRNLIAWNFYNPKDPTELVDIILTHDAKKMKTVLVRSGGHSLPVLAIEELIKMKNESGRSQDLEDIKALRSIRK